MKRLACLLLALLCLATFANAGAIEFSTPIFGEHSYPEGATPSEATFMFRYGLPQMIEGNAVDQAINAYYASLSQDMATTVIPQMLESLDVLPASGEPPYYYNLGYRVTGGGDAYLSILLLSQQFFGNVETESWTANVFALDGVYAGQIVSLSQVMGLEQEDSAEADSYASKLVYRLVWEIIQQQREQIDYYAELNEEGLERVFTPETDFYIDGDGNLVFYIQQGAIASEVEGILSYPFSVAELLTAVKE